MAGRQLKNWCFTVNNNPEVFEARIRILYEHEKEAIQYICGQMEIAPETGRKHFQGYIQMSKQKRMSWMKNHIDAQAHWEAQNARDNNLARDYCKKEETKAPGHEFIEYGEFRTTKGRGTRTDLEELKEKIKSGLDHKSLIEEMPNEYARYVKFVDRCMSIYKPLPHPEGVVLKLYYGAPGTGKTRKAYEDYPDIYCTPISNGALWLDGYDKESEALLDDFSGSLSKWSLTETLRLLDRYPVLAPIKGGFAWWVPKIIIVTTNVHPFKWYKWKGRENQYHALHRRFSEVLYFPLKGEPEEQDPIGFFYDEELIQTQEAELFRPLPQIGFGYDY